MHVCAVDRQGRVAGRLMVGESAFYFLKGFSRQWIVIIIAALPGFEFKQAVPVALMLGVPLKKAFFISVIGNLLPVIPVLLLLESVSNMIIKIGPWKRLLTRVAAAVFTKISLARIWGAVALAVFVALPFSFTGVWGGCCLASLFRIKFRYAFPAIAIGLAADAAAMFFIYYHNQAVPAGLLIKQH